MSNIYCCEFGDKQIECKRVFQEENEEEANKFAQRRAGGMNANLKLKVIRDGQKLYQFVVFSGKENSGYVNIKSNKILSLKKSNIADSIANTLPKEALEYLKSITGINFGNDEEKSSSENAKQESFFLNLFKL